MGLRYEPFDTGGYEALFIDALAEFPGLSIEQFYELGRLGCYHAVFKDTEGRYYEIDIAPHQYEALPDNIVLSDLCRYIMSATGVTPY